MKNQDTDWRKNHLGKKKKDILKKKQQAKKKQCKSQKKKPEGQETCEKMFSLTRNQESAEQTAVSL